MLDSKLLGELEAFLNEARKRGYASLSAKVVDLPDGSKVIEYSRGDWFYRDKYYGGEPYAGSEVIKYQGKVIWSMLYYGAVEPIIADVEPVYVCLQAALRAEPDKKHFSMRGPREFKLADSNFVYLNECNGNITQFDGREQIYCIHVEQYGSKPIYFARYMGGLVDQR